MNRRGFLSDILKVGVAAAILPSAMTYRRQWKQVESLLLPEDVFRPSDYVGEWYFVGFEQRPDGTFKLGKERIVNTGPELVYKKFFGSKWKSELCQ